MEDIHMVMQLSAHPSPDLFSICKTETQRKFHLTETLGDDWLLRNMVPSLLVCPVWLRLVFSRRLVG